MDKPKQRGSNKPKSMSPSRQEKQFAKANRARNIAEYDKHTAGAKPAPPLHGQSDGKGRKPK